MQAGRIYRVPAARQTTVPVTAGNDVGARHSNKSKRDRTQKALKNTEREKNLLSEALV